MNLCLTHQSLAWIIRKSTVLEQLVDTTLVDAALTGKSATEQAARVAAVDVVGRPTGPEHGQGDILW